MEERIEDDHKLSYKEKLNELGIFAITYRCDLNILQIAADGVSGRLVILQIQIKHLQHPRLGPFLVLKVHMHRNRPHYYHSLI